ncbi:MAG: hypothetical protein U0350_16290 [Caldilineaceae bacterium]
MDLQHHQYRQCDLDQHHVGGCTGQRQCHLYADHITPGAATVCTQTGIAYAGQYSNTAVVTGTPTLGPVTPVTTPTPAITMRRWCNSATACGSKMIRMVTPTQAMLPVSNHVVTVTSSSGVVYTTTTDVNGYYTVTVPANDTYTVTTGTLLGRISSVFNGAPGDNQSHNPSGTVVTIGTTDNTTIDFGFPCAARPLGDRAWLESDTDGLPARA